jgi:hypothetical protein
VEAVVGEEHYPAIIRKHLGGFDRECRKQRSG